jgi:hypothetical protein
MRMTPPLGLVNAPAGDADPGDARRETDELLDTLCPEQVEHESFELYSLRGALAPQLREAQ